MKKITLLFLGSILLLSNVLSAQVYVDLTATGTNDGTSWTNAYDALQPALDNAVAGDEIWVAAGTYLPTEEPDGAPTGDNRYFAFHLANKDLKVYGGFMGNETLLSQRDFIANPTTLSGDFNNDDTVTGTGATLNFANNGENAIHVFVTFGLSTGSEIDGFNVQGGNANSFLNYSINGSTIVAFAGGGFINVSSSPNLTNNIFTTNFALDGAGMYNNNSSPVLTNTTFLSNNATNGGGLMNFNSSSPIITNVAFIANNALRGGGMFNRIGSSPILSNVTFSTNNATSEGGAMRNDFSSSPLITNVTFSNNNAEFGGGIYNNSATPIIENTLFYGNTAITNKDIANSPSIPISFSAFEDYDITGCGSCITLTTTPFTDPANPNGADGIPRTSDDGLVLLAGSPPVGAGTATGAPTTDITGTLRPNPPSIGAYELLTMPTAVCQPVTVSTLANCQGEADAVDFDGGSTDPENDPLTFTINPAGPYPVGITNVTLTVSDGTSSDTCMTTITVEDNTAPTAVCQNITVQLDANGEATIVAADVDGGSSDNCGNISLSVSQTQFTCADITVAGPPAAPLLITGVYDGPLSGGTPKGIELKAQTDIPNLSIYGLGSANNGGGTDGIEFTFPSVPVAADTYFYVAFEPTQFANFFGFSPEYTDGLAGINGDDAIELFLNGTVIDTFGDINLDGTGQPWEYTDGWAYRMDDQTVNNGVFDPNNWIYSGPNALDGEMTNATAAAPFPLATFITTTSGNEPVEVTLTVTDDAGNTDTCTAMVTVEDNIDPMLTCPGTQTENADQFCEFVIPDYSGLAMISDNCGVTMVTQTPAPGAIVGTGTTVIELIVTDGTNTVSCGFNINVVNSTPPTIMCPADLTEGVDATCMFTLPDYTSNATTTGGCNTTVTISQSPAPGTVIPLGVTEITLTANDGTFTSNCMFNVTVVDDVAPTAACQDITVQLDANGQATIVASDVDGGSADDCGNVTLSVSQTQFDCDDLNPTGTALSPIIITGVFDGPLTGGTPKGVELKVQVDILDLSIYALGSANNGNGTNGQEFFFPAVSVTAGTYVYVATEDIQFNNFFGFLPDYIDGSVAINGDDAIELFENGVAIDVFGEINVDGTGQPWEYLDGWAYRNNEQTVNNGVFDANNWMYSGINNYDGVNTNAAAPLPFPLASYTVTPAVPGQVTVILTVTDDAGNVSTCNAIVTVEDNIAPMITCPGDQTESVDAFCEFIIPDYASMATAIDNCSSTVTITQDPPPGTFVTQGTTLITLFADDGTTTGSCTFNLDVIDDMPPVITCPADFNETAQAGCVFTIPDYTGMATASDNCASSSSVTITQSPAPGTVVGSGMTQITLTASDGTNASDCMFNITVVDDVAPIVVCPADQVEDADANCEFEIPDYSTMATITDNCGVTTVTQTPAAGTLVGVGDTIVEILATDGANTSSCSFTVTVNDVTPPVIECPMDQTESVDINCEFIIPDYTSLVTATDNCGTVTITQMPAIGTFVTLGTTTITIDATDGTNSVMCTFDINVIDDINPTAECMDITVALDASGTAIIDVSQIDGGSFDNCGNATTSIDIDTFDCSNIGANNVILTAMDDAGNMSSCTAIVTVVDEIAPTAVCQDVTITVNSAGFAFINAADIDDGSTDNCGIASISASQESFSCQDIGDNIVTLTVTDTSGNISTCDAIVTVENNIVAQAQCQNITVVLDANGMATITPDDVYGGPDGACGNSNLTIDIDTFDCSQAETTVPVTLSATDANGTVTSCVAQVFVVDSAAPMLQCPSQDIVVAALAPYEIPDYVANGTVIINDNCPNNLVVTQDPVPGTFVGAGQTEITMTVTDSSGNMVSCQFDIIVDPTLNVGDIRDIKSLYLFPNPASDFVVLGNPQLINLQKARLTDVSGRLIKTFNLNNSSTEQMLDISEIASASYFLIIESDTQLSTISIIKR